MIRSFVDRTTEIALLEEEWKRDGGRLIILYGRRRIGKTRLMTEFTQNKEGIIYFAEDTAKAIQIRKLQHAISQFFGDQLLASLEMTSWDQLFMYLGQHPPTERRYLIIDEFTYLIKNDPSILSALQKSWDMALTDSNWCIILSGSMLGLMTDSALSYTSPLYGRRTRDILLGPLHFTDAKSLLPSYNFKDSLKTYLTIGGIPEYLLKAGEYEEYETFVQREFFNKYGYFYREPYFLLSQEFRELKLYQSILHAIAVGKTAAGAISQFCGVDPRHLYPYMEAMIRLGIIEKELPIFGSKTQGLYRIQDPIFDFWYSHVFPEKQAIEMDRPSAGRESRDPYFGKQFEVYIRKEFFPIILPDYVIGRWWYRGEEIDLIGTNDQHREIIFGECKWGHITEKRGRGILKRLEKKSLNVRHDQYPIEQYSLVCGKIDGKEVLREEGYRVYDMEDIESILMGVVP